MNLPGGTTIDYVIDGLNRRVGKKVCEPGEARGYGAPRRRRGGLAVRVRLAWSHAGLHDQGQPIPDRKSLTTRP